MSAKKQSSDGLLSELVQVETVPTAEQIVLKPASIKDVVFTGDNTHILVESGIEYTVENCVFNGTSENPAIDVQGGILNLLDCEINTSKGIQARSSTVNLLGDTTVTTIAQKDGSSVYLGKMTSEEADTAVVAGTLAESDKGKVTWQGTVNSVYTGVLDIDYDVNFYINGGTINSGISTQNATVKMKDGVIAGRYYGYDASLLHMTGGTINGDVYLIDGGNCEIYGGVVRDGISGNGNNILTISGITLNENLILENSGLYVVGDIEFNGSVEVLANDYAFIYVENDAEFNPFDVYLTNESSITVQNTAELCTEIYGDSTASIYTEDSANVSLWIRDPAHDPDFNYDSFVGTINHAASSPFVIAGGSIGKNATINFAGKTLQFDGGEMYAPISVTNGAKFVMNGGYYLGEGKTVENEWGFEEYQSPIVVTGGSEFVLNAGTLDIAPEIHEGTFTLSGTGVMNANICFVNEYWDYENEIYVDCGNSVFNMTGGTLNGNFDSNGNGHGISISGGVINGEINTREMNSVNVTGGKFQAGSGLYNSDGSMSIEDVATGEKQIEFCEGSNISLGGAGASCYITNCNLDIPITAYYEEHYIITNSTIPAVYLYDQNYSSIIGETHIGELYIDYSDISIGSENNRFTGTIGQLFLGGEFSSLWNSNSWTVEFWGQGSESKLNNDGIILDGEVCDGEINSSIEMEACVTFYMNGGIVRGDISSSGANVSIDYGIVTGEVAVENADLTINGGYMSSVGVTSGKLTMDGYSDKDIVSGSDLKSAIIDGSGRVVDGVTLDSNDNSGVKLSNCTFVMNGGIIQNCTSTTSGGGVYLEGSSTFTMNGGEINDCSTQKNGGAIYLGSGTKLYLKGGYINNGIAWNDSGQSSTMRGGAVYVASGATMTMSDGEITGSGDDSIINANAGGAVYVAGTASFTGGSIKNCVSEVYGGAVYNVGTVTFDGTDITGSYCGDRGGAYFGGANSVAEMKSGTFSGNTAKQTGGGIRLYSTAKFTFNGGTLTKNTAGIGGNVYVISSGAKFIMNDGTISGIGNGSSRDSSKGGAIYNSSGTVEINGGTIKNCLVTEHGGAIYNLANLTINKVSIENCESYLSSGAIYNTGSAVATINNVNITGCDSSTSGGAIGNEAKMTLNNITIQDCCASQKGGAIYNVGILQCSDVVVKVCSSVSGGGIYSQGKISFSGANNIVTGNTASNGGGLWLSTFDSDVNLTSNVNITKNTASYSGGGIYVKDTGDYQLFIDGAKIEENKKTENVDLSAYFGGGIYALNSNILMYSGSISNNYCNVNAHGGGVYLNNSTFSFDGGTIHNNRTTTSANGGNFYVASGSSLSISNLQDEFVFSGDGATTQAYYGGGIYNAGTLSFDLYEGNVPAVFTSLKSISAGSAIYNSADGSINYILNDDIASFSIESCVMGMAFYNNGTINNTISKLTINGCSGRAFYTTKNCTITHSSFTGNGAGAIGVSSKAEVTFENVTVSGNTGTSAVYVYDGKVNFSNGSIEGNQSTNASGGGIYIYGTSSVFNLTNSIVKNNKTEVYGGNIYVNDGATLNVEGTAEKPTTISGDGTTIQTTNFGGSICNVGKTTLKYVTIEGTVSEQEGGAIYNTGTLIMESVNISNCKSVSSNGGGIYSDGSITLKNDSKISGCSASNGAGLYIVNGNLNYSSDNEEKIPTIESNIATSLGGGIYTESGSISNLNDDDAKLIIQSNSAVDGGGIYINSGTFTIDCNVHIHNNITDASNGKGGNVFVAKQSNFTISDGVISGDGVTVNAKYGGGVYNNGTTNLNGGKIEKCVASTYGGGLYDNKTAIIDGAEIYGCISNDRGGAILINSSGSTTMKSGLISENQAKVTGGGVRLVSTASFTLEGGTIINNKIKTINSSAKGGNVYVGSATSVFIMKNGTISGGGSKNDAYYGGGVYNVGKTTITGGIIEGCNANTGAGIYNTGTLALTSVTIDNCRASSNGGGVYIDENSSITTGKDLKINNCYAGDYGAGIYTNVITATILGEIIDCESGYYGGAICSKGADLTVSILAQGNKSRYGAAIYLFSGTLTLDGSNIISNDAVVQAGGVYTRTDGNSVVNFLNGEISDCSAQKGGAAYFNTATVNIAKDGGSFKIDNNSATEHSGGIHTTNDCVINIYDGTVISNNKLCIDSVYSSGSGHAAGITAYGETVITMYGGIIENNTIGSYAMSPYGSGVYVSGNSTYTMNGGIIRNNIINNDLGGGSNVCVNTGSTFILNDGEILGSGNVQGPIGVGINNFGNTVLNGGTISNCVASDFGGAIANYGQLYLNGVVIENCVASKFGGAIANIASEYEIDEETGEFVDATVLYLNSGEIRGCSATSGIGNGIFTCTDVVIDRENFKCTDIISLASNTTGEDEDITYEEYDYNIVPYRTAKLHVNSVADATNTYLIDAWDYYIDPETGLMTVIDYASNMLDIPVLLDDASPECITLTQDMLNNGYEMYSITQDDGSIDYGIRKQYRVTFIEYDENSGEETSYSQYLSLTEKIEIDFYDNGLLSDEFVAALYNLIIVVGETIYDFGAHNVAVGNKYFSYIKMQSGVLYDSKYNVINENSVLFDSGIYNPYSDIVFYIGYKTSFEEIEFDIYQYDDVQELNYWNDYIFYADYMYIDPMNNIVKFSNGYSSNNINVPVLGEEYMRYQYIYISGAELYEIYNYPQVIPVVDVIDDNVVCIIEMYDTCYMTFGDNIDEGYDILFDQHYYIESSGPDLYIMVDGATEEDYIVYTANVPEGYKFVDFIVEYTTDTGEYYKGAINNTLYLNGLYDVHITVEFEKLYYITFDDNIVDNNSDSIEPYPMYDEVTLEFDGDNLTISNTDSGETYRAILSTDCRFSGFIVTYCYENGGDSVKYIYNRSITFDGTCDVEITLDYEIINFYTITLDNFDEYELEFEEGEYIEIVFDSSNESISINGTVYNAVPAGDTFDGFYYAFDGGDTDTVFDYNMTFNIDCDLAIEAVYYDEEPEEPEPEEKFDIDIYGEFTYSATGENIVPIEELGSDTCSSYIDQNLRLSIENSSDEYQVYMSQQELSGNYTRITNIISFNNFETRSGYECGVASIHIEVWHDNGYGVDTKEYYWSTEGGSYSLDLSYSTLGQIIRIVVTVDYVQWN